MRWLLVCLVLLPVAHAGVWEDPEGDVMLENLESAAVPADEPSVDVLTLWVGNESAETFQVGFEVQAPPAEDDEVSFHVWEIRLVSDGATYRLSSQQCGPGEARLMRAVGTLWDSGPCIAYAEDGTSIRVDIAKSFLRDARRNPLTEGSEIKDLQVEVARFLGTPGTRYVDRAPDAPTDLAMVFSESGVRIGDVTWTIDEPIHRSNGVLGLFRSDMGFVNRGSEDAVVRLEQELPMGWQGVLPAQALVPAGAEVVVPIAFIPPGAHAHGGAVTWPVRATVGEATAEQAIGLDFYAEPQPAGHHPTLWMHAGETPGTGLPGATTVVAWLAASEPPDQVHRVDYDQQGATSALWQAFLQPELLEPLAFDPGQREAQVRLAANAPVPGGSIAVQVAYCDPSLASPPEPSLVVGCPEGEAIVLGRGDATFEAHTDGSFSTEIPITFSQAWLFPAVLHDALGVAISVDIGAPVAPGDLAQLQVEVPGTFVDLPLRDRPIAVDEARAYGLRVLEWTPSDCSERAVHTLTIENPGEAGRLDWAGVTSPGTRMILPDPSLLDAGERQTFQIPMGSEPHMTSGFGVVVASLPSGSAFASWVHEGPCPMGAQVKDALEGDRSSKATPNAFAVLLLGLAGAAILRR